MIIERFQAQVQAAPHETAVKFGDDRVTYDELNNLSNRVARAILHQIMGKESPGEAGAPRVALLFEHSIDMIVGVLGTLKAGCAYVPLDTAYPPSRLEYMLGDSGSSLILTNEKNLPFAWGLLRESNLDIYIINIDSIGEGSYSVENAERDASPDKLAYILYTSGSTGQPKGVAQTHRNVLYYTRNWIQRFSITGKDRMTFFSAFSHDGAVQDILGALLSGACLYPYSLKAETEADLYRLLKEEKITIWHSVPTLFRYFTGTLTLKDYFPGIRWVLLGGEPLREQDLVLHKTYFPKSVLANVYGQTESSVSSICSLLPGASFDELTLGDPLDETKIIIVGEEGEIIENIGVGEIVVVGDYLSPGYWKDDTKSSRVFIRNDELGYLYRTGDLGRLTAQGKIKILGRKDFQVKIRGFRVELGEIETQMLQVSSIKEAVVVVKQDAEDNNYLCAYFVSEKKVEIAQIRDFLATKVPGYMIPLYWTQVDEMPLTPSGKIDKKALPEPQDITVEHVFVPPRDEIEKELVNIWSSNLGIDSTQIGIDDNFFQLGGHSIKAAIIGSEIGSVFGVKMPLGELLKIMTIRELAAYIRKEKDLPMEACLPLEPVEEREYYPVSSAQIRMYLQHQKNPANTNYNITTFYAIDGDVDVSLLENVLSGLCSQHEALRTSFMEHNGEIIQKIEKEVKLKLNYKRSSEEDFKKDISKFLLPFDLREAPLMHAYLFEVSEKNFILFFNIHHIISDGTSIEILVKDLSELYRGMALSPLNLQYKDHVMWQAKQLNAHQMQVQEKYWVQILKDYTYTQLPADNYDRYTKIEGKRKSLTIDKKIIEEIDKFCAHHEISRFVFFQTVFYILLYHETGQTDILVGIPVSNREHPDLKKVMGIFLNLIPLRFTVDPSKSFISLVKENKRNFLEGLNNQYYPYELLNLRLRSERQTDHADFFSILYNYLPAGDKSELQIPGLKISHYLPTDTFSPRYDMTMYVKDLPGTLTLILEYKSNLYFESTIINLLKEYFALVEVFRKEDNADVAIDALNPWSSNSEAGGFEGDYADFFDKEELN